MSNKPDDTAMRGIAAGLGRIPSGCAIMTATSESDRTGMLASWYQQAAMDPPAVCVAVRQGRPIESIIDASGAFVLNLLGEDPGPMFKHFGKGFGPGEEAFEGLETTDVAGGVLIPDRIAWLSARVLSRTEAGDHWLYIGVLTDGDGEIDKAPYVHIRKNGLGY